MSSHPRRHRYRAGQVPVFRQGQTQRPRTHLEQDVTAALNAGVDGSGAKVETAPNLEVVERIIEGAGHGQETRQPRADGSGDHRDATGTGQRSLAGQGRNRGMKALLFGSEELRGRNGCRFRTRNAMTLPAQQHAIAAKSQGLAALGLPGSIRHN